MAEREREAREAPEPERYHAEYVPLPSGGSLAGGPAGGDQRERAAQLEADQRNARPCEPGSLPGVGQERLLLRIDPGPATPMDEMEPICFA